MAGPTITEVKARWILDSRGNPTVECDLRAGDIFARAAVPSGASTGEGEAVELRDGGKAFMGKHVSKAVSNVNDIIAKKVVGMDVTDQKALDQAMRDLDGTKDKGKLGANAILSVSMAAVKAAALSLKKPLYQYIYELTFGKAPVKYLMPVPGSNVLNGGQHAGTSLAIQEFMVFPVGARSYMEGLQMIVETYHNLKELLKNKYGKSAINVGDEGGFAPNLKTTSETLDIIMAAIEKAGYGGKVKPGIDAAATSFYSEKAATYAIDGGNKTAGEMVDYYMDLVKAYPIVSIEDPFDEEDFDSFSKLMARLPGGINLVTDDLTVTNVELLRKAIDMKAGNTLLMKVNQIGTITESIAAANLAFKNGWGVMTSHRSGETEDNTIADIAVGFCSGIIKPGAPCRTDRNAKYNQLIRIAEALGDKADYPSDFGSFKKYQ
ncbi:MAG: phosphopyruvate hydratase [Candidatus Lokiarchaeota archaeon]|nr:phosphopyruvate hydratase [Candidatus Lokiarchaeota archaeon]